MTQMSWDDVRPLFPATASAPGGVLHLGGITARRLAARFGTPLYVYDAQTLRAGARAYAEPVAAARGGGRVHFAAKALPVPGALAVLRAEGLGVDVASAGEIAAAVRAGFEGGDMVVHGNGKSAADLAAALDVGAGLVVLDSADDALALAAEARRRRVAAVDVLIRLRPGLDVTTHPKVATGHAGSKFGLAPDAAVALAAELPAPLRLRGLHAHLGSQVPDGSELRRALEAVVRVADRLPAPCTVLDLGGGLGVPYRVGDPAPDPRRHAEAAVAAVGALDPAPRLLLEPGRSVAARAGITLYEVLGVKRDGGSHSWVTVDGGMADNARPALYGAAYHFEVADRVGAPADAAYAIAGRHCESGDQLGDAVPLPSPRPGDLIAVPMTGAYHQSMASTYNLFGRPAAVMVDGGSARLITRRETIDDLLARDVA